MIRLQPQTLQRIRDHFLEVGQPASVSFLRHRQVEEDPFAGDPDARRRFEALFEAMYLMIEADGEVAESEREVLRGAVRGLTDNAVRSVHIEKLIEECRERAKDGTKARLAAIAPTLKEDPALVEAAFSLAAAVAFADQDIKDAENDLINDLADALDLDGERAEQLLNQLEQESAGG
jgi:tellurite resistance protein